MKTTPLGHTVNTFAFLGLVMLVDKTNPLKALAVALLVYGTHSAIYALFAYLDSEQ